jgi:general secretion pathway protein G
MMQRGRERGFTLIEMVIVVAIVGILASAAYPVANLVAQRARESELRIALRQMREAIDEYKRATEPPNPRVAKSLEASGYPPRLDDLAQGVADKSSPKESYIYFLRRIPRDPMNPDTSLAPADTWGTRSYASPPDSPQEGADVFDVYSRSDKIGLNGVPYREW